MLRATTAHAFSTSERQKVLRNPFNALNFWLGNVLRARTACTFWTSQVVRDHQFLTLMTWKCASRHNSVHFFNISTSKSGPTLVCFLHFWLGKVLRATTVCTFSTAQLLKVLRSYNVFCTLNFDFEMFFAPQRHTIVHLSSGQMALRPPL